MLAGASNGPVSVEEAGWFGGCLCRKTIWTVCKPFQIDGEMDRGGIIEFMYDMDGPALLKRDLAWIGISRHQSSWLPMWTSAHSYYFRASDQFFNVKSDALCTMKSVHKIEGFAISESGDRLGQVDVRVGYTLCPLIHLLKCTFLHPTLLMIC